jgi:hypothetical protein
LRVFPVKELIVLCGKWEKIARDASRRRRDGSRSQGLLRYSGDSGNKSILNQPLLYFEGKLIDLYEQNKKHFAEKLEADKIKTILVRNLASRDESEMDRSAVQNSAISRPEKFDDMSNIYRHEAKRKFEERLKPLSSFKVKEELRQAMDSELNKVFLEK